MKALVWLKQNYYDPKFSQNKLRYFVQSGFATLSVLITLLTLNILPNAVVIASIGSSAFAIFTMPHRDSTRTKLVLGGYVIGVAVGTLCFFLDYFFLSHLHIFLMQMYHEEIFAALSVGLSMFAMVVFNAEHPPASAIALGLVLAEWSIKTIVVTLLAISLILFFRHLFRKHLIDLT